MWDVIFIFLLLLVAIIVVTSFGFSEKYNLDLTSRTYTFGLNGIAGDTINMSCPSGKSIQVEKAHYICTSGTQNISSNGQFENPNCDPFWQSTGQNTTFFNPANTVDYTSTLSKMCNGSNSFSFQIPQSIINICGQTSPNSLKGTPCDGQLQLVGTYDCV